jgi:hypothetical protein
MQKKKATVGMNKLAEMTVPQRLRSTDMTHARCTWPLCHFSTRWHWQQHCSGKTVHVSDVLFNQPAYSSQVHFSVVFCTIHDCA